MKKRIRALSLCLAVVLLLGMIPGAVFAATPEMKVSLTLTDSIAINYKISADTVTADAFERVEFYNGDTLLKTVTLLPAADENGMYVFSYTDIAPHMMGYTVTAKLYAGDLYLEQEASIAAYCNAILKNPATYGDKLSVLAMELLDYGAAAQKYYAARQSVSVAETDLVNYGIAEAYPDIEALCDHEELTLNSVKSVGAEMADPAAVWTGVGLYLQDSISIRYKFTAESVEDLTMMAISGENSWSVTEFHSAGDGAWYAYFDGLNPARMRDTVVVMMYNSQGETVSNLLSYSIESYAADILQTTNDEDLKTLVQEMIRYGDATADWAYTPPEIEPIVRWEPLVTLDFENGTLTEMGVSQWNDSTNSFALAEDVGHNSSKSLQLNNTARAKYYRAGAKLAAGEYRVSGYVYLNGAAANKVDVQIWEKKAGETGNNTPRYYLSNYIIGEADENGWSYFEIDIQQPETQPTFQFVFNNDSGSVKTVYFDDVVYAQRIEEMPEVTEPAETEPVETEPEETLPELPNIAWEPLATLDFEAGTLAEIGVSQWSDSTNSFALSEDVGYNSDKSLQLNNTARAKFYQAGVTQEAGDYRISGYVYLNGADAAKVNIQVWEKKAGETGNNTPSYPLSNYIVGDADENGWSYFAIPIQQPEKQPTFQFVFNNNVNSGKTVYFDDVIYAKAVEIEEPEPEIIWGDMIDVLDFEQGALEPFVAHAGDPQVVNTSRPIENGQSLRLEGKEQAKYSQSATVPAGDYRISGYVKLGNASATSIAVTYWTYQAASATATTTMDNAIVGDADEYGWSYFVIYFRHEAKYTATPFIVKNNGSETVYFDDITYARYTGDGQPATDTAQTAFETLAKLDFEGSEFPMVQNSTYTLGDIATPGYGSSNALRLNTGDRARYSNNNLPQTASGSYKITGWFKRDNPNTAVTVTYWYRLSTGDNSTATIKLEDTYILETSGNWQCFELPVAQEGATTLVQFILNNTSSTGENAGYIYFDDIRYMRAYDENDLIALQWQEKLDAEQQESMMIQDVLDDPYAEQTPIGPNLITNGDFSAETDLLLMDKEVKANATGWTTVDRKTYDTYSKITAEGAFYGEAPVGYNDPQVYNRPVPQLHQIVKGIVPGAVYQLKFRYRIEQSNSSSSSWYGPYVVINDGESSTTLSADKATGGLVTTGQWQWFTQTVVLSGEKTSVNFDLCMWLYEGDWCEVDDVQFYMVDKGNYVDLDMLTKFFYTDMGTATFTVDLKETIYTDVAADTNAAVKFEVFDGKTLVWNSEALKLTGEGYTAQAEFDLAKLTKLGAPYVVKATLYNGSGEVLFETTEQIFIYNRPTSLDSDGNFIKKTPTGEDLNFTMAYAITQKDYANAKEVGCNVMSLSNARSAEQVLKLLDYCYSQGCMGFLNMNWGLYNTDDINSKRCVLIDVASDERIRNHPSMLGYCLSDEPWSWGSEADVAANLEEGYRLIREYDTENIIFSVDNMPQFHEKSVMYGDVLFVDHYNAPAGGAIYDRVSTAVNAAGGRMPVWAALGAYKQNNYYPTGSEVRNEVWQAFIAGTNGIGYYAISYSDYDENGPVSIWNVTDSDGNPVGQETWNAMVSFKEKEWDIAFDRFANGKGKTFNEKIDINKGYMYSSWVDQNGDLYFIVLNVSSSLKFVTLPMTSSNAQVSFSEFTATVINGGNPTTNTIGKNFYVWLEGNQAVLYKITPKTSVDFSLLG